MPTIAPLSGARAVTPDVGGELLRTIDGGVTWQQVAPLAAYVSAMFIDPSESRRVITGRRYTKNVFAIDTVTGLDALIGDALPGLVKDITVDAATTPPTLYVGTDRGIYTRAIVAGNAPWALLPGSQSLSVNSLRLARAPDNPARLTVIAATETGVQQSTIDTRGALKPVYRFFNRDTQAHFYTASPAERDYIVAHWPEFANEGVAFYALAEPEPSSTPMYRFYNVKTGVHAYALGAAERAALQALPDQIDEGPMLYLLSAAEPGASALYRFYNATTGGHLLTTDDDERDYVRRRLRQFAFVESSPGVFQAAQ